MRTRRTAAAKLLAGFALTIWLAAVVLTARRGDPDLYPPRPGEPAVAIFVVDNGFHADLALPRPDIALTDGPTANAARMLPPGPWVEAGWGDERFYRGTGLSPARLADGLRSLFWPGNRSTIRLEALAGPPDRVYPSTLVTPVRLSERGFRRLVERMDRSFQKAGGRPVRGDGAPDDPGGVFFRSVERFSLLRLCNHWTADMLNAAGLPVTPVVDTLTGGLLLDLRLRAGVSPHRPGDRPVRARATAADVRPAR